MLPAVIIGLFSLAHSGRKARDWLRGRDGSSCRPETVLSYVESKYLVYGLVDPRNHMVRYIGQSSRGMKRPRAHRSKPQSDQTHCARWVRSLHGQGLDFEIVVLECCTEETLDDAECWWIAYGRCSGWP